MGDKVPGNDTFIANDSDSDSGRATSPDSQCVICLGRLRSKSFSDSCLHNFCFACLVKWSRVKAECPLCKQPFRSIIHNVQPNGQYERHFVPTTPPVFSDVLSYRVMVRVYRDQAARQMVGESLVSQQMASIAQHHILPSSAFVAPRPALPERARNPRSDMLQFRSNIYHENRWVNNRLNSFGARRGATPSYFRQNPQALQRLWPWVRREMQVLHPLHSRRARAGADEIMASLVELDMDSMEFSAMLERHLADRAYHFLHEFRTFATSYYDMAGFDENAVYGRQTQWQTGRDGDSDVEVIDIMSPASIRPAPPIIISDNDSDLDVQVISRAPVTPIEVVLISDDEQTIVADESRDSGALSGSASEVITLNENTPSEGSSLLITAVKKAPTALPTVNLRSGCKYRKPSSSDTEDPVAGPSTSAPSHLCEGRNSSRTSSESRDHENHASRLSGKIRQKKKKRQKGKSHQLVSCSNASSLKIKIKSDVDDEHVMSSTSRTNESAVSEKETTAKHKRSSRSLDSRVSYWRQFRRASRSEGEEANGHRKSHRRQPEKSQRREPEKTLIASLPFRKRPHRIPLSSSSSSSEDEPLANLARRTSGVRVRSCVVVPSKSLISKESADSN